MRLNKFISSNGVTSRRKADILISEGKVKINNVICIEHGTKIDPKKDIISVNEQIIKNDINKIVYIFNKPIGVVSSVYDKFEKNLIINYFKKEPYRLFPIGRLDKNSTGMILLTNDGELTNSIIHPKYKIKKKYYITVIGKLNDNNKRKLENGIMLEDGITQPCHISDVTFEQNRTNFYIEISEGRNRQIRRMCESINHKVTFLKRISIGQLNLNNLKIGEYKKLNQSEINKIFE